MKCQIGTFHELLPGNLVFFHFYYIGTKEIAYLNQSIELSIKSYISMEILRFGIKILCKTSRDQTVAYIMLAYIFLKLKLGYFKIF